MRNKLQTKYTPWVYVNGLPGWEDNTLNIKAYRLWLETDGRLWWQRHEWLYEDNRTYMEKWIDSAIKHFPDHYIEIMDDDLNDK